MLISIILCALIPSELLLNYNYFCKLLPFVILSDPRGLTPSSRLTTLVVFAGFPGKKNLVHEVFIMVSTVRLGDPDPHPTNATITPTPTVTSSTLLTTTGFPSTTIPFSSASSTGHLSDTIVPTGFNPTANPATGSADSDIIAIVSGIIATFGILTAIFILLIVYRRRQRLKQYQADLEEDQWDDDNSINAGTPLMRLKKSVSDSFSKLPSISRSRSGSAESVEMQGDNISTVNSIYAEQDLNELHLIIELFQESFKSGLKNVNWEELLEKNAQINSDTFRQFAQIISHLNYHQVGTPNFESSIVELQDQLIKIKNNLADESAQLGKFARSPMPSFDKSSPGSPLHYSSSSPSIGSTTKSMRHSTSSPLSSSASFDTPKSSPIRKKAFNKEKMLSQMITSIDYILDKLEPSNSFPATFRRSIIRNFY